ncbi:MAG: AI-2E family transporter [Bacteroidota bacterium]
MSERSYRLFVTGVLIIGLLVFGKFMLSPIFYGIFFAVLFAPIIRFFKKVLPWYPVAFLATLLTTLFFTGLVLSLMYMQISSLSFDFAAQADSPEELLQRVEEALKNAPLLGELELRDMVTQLGGLAQQLLNFIQAFLQSSGSFLVNIGLALVFSFYFGGYYTKARNVIFNRLSDRKVRKYNGIFSESSKVIRGYVVGLFIVSFILAILNSIGFLIVGLDNAIFWAVFVALFAIVPYVGPFLSMIVVLSYSLVSSGGLAEPTFVLLSFIIVQQIEGNFITPKVVGDKIDINPLIVIILILFFGTIWGVEGIIICLPMAGVAKTFIDGLTKDSAVSKMIEAD